MAKTKIEWCAPPGYLPEVWNYLVGWTKQSEGCENCYALRTAGRLSQIGSTRDKYQPTVKKMANGEWQWTGKIGKGKLLPNWSKPRFVFVNSMGDMFHDNVDFEDIFLILDEIYENPKHWFFILTKFPYRMKEMMGRWLEVTNTFRKLSGQAGIDHIQNLILGVSAENQKTANQRIPILLETPARVRAVSLEPLLEDVKLWRVNDQRNDRRFFDVLNGTEFWEKPDNLAIYHVTESNKLDWVIVGGESGKRARPNHPEWVKEIQLQCAKDSVPFFFKQWGEWAPEQMLSHPIIKKKEGVIISGNGKITEEKPKGKSWALPFYNINEYGMIKVGKKMAGRKLYGEEYNEYPTAITQPTT